MNEQFRGRNSDSVIDSDESSPVVLKSFETLNGSSTKSKTHPANGNAAVSTQEHLGMEDVDLDSGKVSDPTKPVKKPPALKSVRYYVMLMALVSPFVVTYSRTIINFAITEMIDPAYLERMRQNMQQNSEAAPPNSTSSGAYFDLDNSCPVDDATRSRLLEELGHDIKRAKDGRGETFEWDTIDQGWLKAAYAIGHSTLQIVGGRLSEIYGSHIIMSISSVFIGICCLSAPFLASLGYYLLFLDLLFLGVLGSFMTPALITLISNWLTPSEKSMMISFYLVSSRLGYALSSGLCGFLIQAELSWRYLFYTAGWIGIGFAGLFSMGARSRPEDHYLMGKIELEYLASKNTLVRESIARGKKSGLPTNKEAYAMQSRPQTQGIEEKVTQNGHDKLNSAPERSDIPWVAILTSSPVWAFVITKFCVKLAGDTVQIELPAYLKRVMHFPGKYNGMLNALNYIIFCVSCLVVGGFSKFINKKRPFGISKTAVRKLFQCSASFGVALILLGISFSVCYDSPTMILLPMMFVMTTFSTGGEAQIPMDITERYSGTIHALGSSLAISGVIEPVLAGMFLKGRAADRDRWASVWIAASFVSFLGGLIFLIFGDAKIQPFDSANQRSDEANRSNLARGHHNKGFDGSGDSTAKVKTSDDLESGCHKESHVI